MRRNFLVRLFLFMGWITHLYGQTPDTLSLKDIWYSGKYADKSSADYHALKDGKHYTQLINVPDGQSIVEFDFTTGRATDTLMNAGNFIPWDSSRALRIADYEFNDDESDILIDTGRQKIYRHSFLANYFVFNRKTKKLLPVSSNGKEQSCVISPDGSMAAFVRNNNLIIKNFLTNEEYPITTDGMKNHIINGVSDWVYEEEFAFTTAFQWSPDGKHLAYYRFDETEVPEYTVQFFKDLYPENYTYKYPKVGEKNSVVSIHIYDVATKKTMTVDAGSDTDQYIPRIKWTENANELCVFRMNRLQNKLELLLADATTGTTHVMFTETNSRYIEINDALTFFNHNKDFIWMSEQNGWEHLYNYTTSGQLVNEITKGNYDVTKFYGVDEKNSMLYYQSAEVSPLDRYVYSIKLDGNNKKQISKQQGTNDASFNPAFSYYMITHSDASAPPDFRLYDQSGKELRVLEDNHELISTLKSVNLPGKEFFQFKTSENVLLNGYMIKPVDFNSAKKYPVLMTFYGGPGSQSVLNSWGGQIQLYFDYLTTKGYIIVCVDNRGTGARGEEFRKLTYLQLGHYECIDQIETAKYLRTLPYVDASRIGTYGWSYGGFLSTLCIEKGNDVFKAAVAVAPVTNWKYYDDIYTERYMQTDKENKSGYEDNSPVNYANKIKGHFLVIHGLADDNVHYQNTAMLLKQLYAANIHFDQMVFPDKNHSINGGTTRYYLYENITNWIIKNL